LFFCRMKIIFKWAGLFVIPSVLVFLYMVSLEPAEWQSVQVAFYSVHYLFAGIAIYLTLTELKRKSVEVVSALRYIIVGILTAVSHSLILGLFTGLYFNVINVPVKDKFVNEYMLPGVVRGKDSTANTKQEYYDHLMEGKDSGVLLPERYAEYKKAARDSVQEVDKFVEFLVQNNFSWWGNVIGFVGFAPVIGILFSIVVTVFVTKR
jgi:hypothetical protein